MIRIRRIPSLLTLLALASIAGTAPMTASAQDAPEPPTPPDRPERMRRAAPPALRGARLGIHAEATTTDDGVDGVLVRRVVPGSAAEDAGLEDGDVLVAVDGRSLADADGAEGGDALDGLLGELADREPGDVVEVTYLRDGERLQTGVELDEGGMAALHRMARAMDLSPAERRRIREEMQEVRRMTREQMEDVRRELRRVRDREGERMRRMREDLRSLPGMRWMEACRGLMEDGPVMPGRCVAGLEVRDLDPELGEYFGAETGALVLDVADESPLELEPGDVVLAVGDREIEDADDLRRILRSYEEGESVELEVLRRGSRTEVTVQLP